VSNIIIVVLSLIILVVIVSNVIMWSYQMNQLDWERNQEKIEITGVVFVRPNSVQITVENQGPTAHLVSLWINNATLHYHEDIDAYVDSGGTLTYVATFGWKLKNTYTFNLVTERGNTATFSTAYNPSVGAMLSYGEGTVTFPRYRLWNGVSWESESSEGATSATIEWTLLKSCPIRNEKILAVLSSAGYLSVSVWNGNTQTWTTPIRMPSVGTIIDAYRLFDIAYEQNSGRGIIVYNPTATGVDPEYRIWNGSVWSSPQTINVATTGVIYWIELASKPLSNEVALMTLDANLDVYGMIWNGAIWSNGLLLENTAAIATEENIAVEYMQVSKKAMFVWGSGTSVQSRIWDGTVWNSELASVSISATPNWFSLKADPNSDGLVLVSVDGDSDLNTIRWAGSSWILDTQHDNSVETNAARCADVEFETTSGHEGHIILVWGDNNVNSITYKHFDGSSWGSATQIPTSTIPTSDQQWHVLRRSGDDKILLATLDNSQDINTAYWDGANWFWSDEVEVSASTTSMQSFDVAPDV
jgi:hypothetical protein